MMYYRLFLKLKANKIFKVKSLAVVVVMLSAFVCSAQITQEKEVLKHFIDQIPSLQKEGFIVSAYTNYENGNFVASYIGKETCDTALCVLLISDSLYSLPERKDSANIVYYDSVWMDRKESYPNYPVDSFMYNRKKTSNHSLKKTVLTKRNNFTVETVTRSKLFSEYLRHIESNRIVLGYIRLSRIYFDEDCEYAVMLYWYYKKTVLKAYMVLFDNEDGYWKVKENIVIGIF